MTGASSNSIGSSNTYGAVAKKSGFNKSMVGSGHQSLPSKKKKVNALSMIATSSGGKGAFKLLNDEHMAQQTINNQHLLKGYFSNDESHH